MFTDLMGEDQRQINLVETGVFGLQPIANTTSEFDTLCYQDRPTPILMSLGLLFLGTDLCGTSNWSVYSWLSALKGDWNPWLMKKLMISVQVGVGGAVIGFLGHEHPFVDT